jgi:gas vesicle protein
MDKKTTQVIGGIFGAVVGLFAGAQYGKLAEMGVEESIDRLDNDSDDVNNFGNTDKDKKGDAKE